MCIPQVGRALLKVAFPQGGLGSSRLFFTEDLQPTLSWASRSSLTHSGHIFMGLPWPLFIPTICIDWTQLISTEERSTCPNHRSLRLRMSMVRSSRPSFLCSSSIFGSSDGLTPHIQRTMARSFRHSLWQASEDMGQVSVACSMELHTFELNRRPLSLSGNARAHDQPPPALNMSLR